MAGVAENGEIDPLIGFPEVRAILWQNGGIIDLGTLPEGGYESVANAVDSRGQVAGIALNTVPDAYSMVGLGYQTRAFLWQNGVMQDLGTLGGPDAMANTINERGQIVGVFYTSSTPTQAEPCVLSGFGLTTGAFLWENGKMVNLGSLGGTCTLATFAPNGLGQIVGEGSLAGDQAASAFLWEPVQFASWEDRLADISQGPVQSTIGGKLSALAFFPETLQLMRLSGRRRGASLTSE